MNDKKTSFEEAKALVDKALEGWTFNPTDVDQVLAFGKKMGRRIQVENAMKGAFLGIFFTACEVFPGHTEKENIKFARSIMKKFKKAGIIDED